MEFLFNIIMFVCMYPVVLILYFVANMAGSPNKDRLLGVTLQTEWLQDETVTAITKKYKKQLNRITLVFAILPFLTFLIRSFAFQFTFWMMWLLIVMGVLVLPYISAYRNLMRYKKERMAEEGMTKEESFIPVANQRTLHLQSFVLPWLLTWIPLLVSFGFRGTHEFVPMLSVALSSLILVPALALGAVGMDLARPVTISRNPEINRAFMLYKKDNWNRYWCMVAWMSAALMDGIFASAFLLPVTVFPMIVLATVYTVALILPVIQVGMRIKRKANEYHETDPDAVTVDEDDHWILGAIYYNREDSHTFVEKRYGIGTTVNMATRFGKGLTVFTGLALLAIPASCVLVILLEITPIDLSLQGNTLVATQIRTDYQIPVEDITSMQVITELPDRSRTNGTGMDSLEKGHFDVEGYGSSLLFLNPQNHEFLVVKAGEKTYILSEETDKDTQQMYQQLKELQPSAVAK